MLEFCTVTSSASSQSSKTSEIGQNEKHGDLLKAAIEYKQSFNYRKNQILCDYEYNAPRVDFYKRHKQIYKDVQIHVNGKPEHLLIENEWWLLVCLYMPNSGEEYDEDQFKVVLKVPFQHILKLKIEDKYSVMLQIQYYERDLEIKFVDIKFKDSKQREYVQTMIGS